MRSVLTVTVCLAMAVLFLLTEFGDPVTPDHTVLDTINIGFGSKYVRGDECYIKTNCGQMRVNCVASPESIFIWTRGE